MPFFEGIKMTGGYGNGPDIINSCSVDVNRGEIVSILGPNGAGKSTAMKAMLGLLNLKSGSVVIDGKDISKLSPQERVKAGISFVPQTKNVFAGMTLGRTMMVDAKLVLLDEVGAGVNRTLLKDLGTAILKLNKEQGYTFCMIEHDMDFISRLCDPVIVMAEGSVLFEGTADEVKKDEKVIESYLGRGSKLKDEN